ncbi:hypothetical protein Taro_043544 [Colocasia esculenta]|uniref:Uncharacterized protein n=1 Tax=Colocasia esculenta TaxID=4460 RepID=A0A843WW26_COLES|nr:hypothetical protein [Colocasia esculenta]
MSKPQLFFPSYNRTPKHHGCLNALHQTLGDEFTSFWGRVEEFLVAGEQEIVHTKPFFFPFSSTVTYTNRPLEVDQSKTFLEATSPPLGGGSLVPSKKGRTCLRWISETCMGWSAWAGCMQMTSTRVSSASSCKAENALVESNCTL